MNILKWVVLCNLVLLFVMLVVEARFGDRSLGRSKRVLNDDATFLGKLVGGWNRHVRFACIFVFGFGSAVFANQVRYQRGEESLLLLWIAGGGFVLYFVALGLRGYFARSN